MQRIILLIVLFALQAPIYAQRNISAKSNVKQIQFKQTVNSEGVRFKAELEISNLTFNDDNNNGVLDANENSFITFTISNNGKGEASDVSVLLEPKRKMPEGMQFEGTTSIGIIYPEQSTQVFIPIAGLNNLESASNVFLIRIIEKSGFNPSPEPIAIETRKFLEPEVLVADAIFSTKNGKPVEINNPVYVKALIQNIGEGIAENIVAEFVLPSGNCLPLTQKIQNIGTLRQGESKEIKFSFVATQGYSQDKIPVKIVLTESYGAYAKGQELSVSFGEELLATNYINAENSEKKEIKIASLTPEVDKNIPESEVKYPNRIALIIGNEDYQNKQTDQNNGEVNVKFARNDARIFREYVKKIMGVEEMNIFFLTDATAAEMNDKIELVSKLANRLGSDAEIIFYYAGHGLPDEVSRSPYLIPVDVSGVNLSSAIPVKDVYAKLGNSGATRVTVFLDACFSGGGRNAALIATRGIRVKPKDELLPGNIVVFAASSDQQTALPYEEKQHGMFTYFLLKGLQETKGEINYGELSGYLQKSVAIESLRVNNKDQEPNITFSSGIAEEWMKWGVK
jgi:uncharacterized caspase-like protein